MIMRVYFHESSPNQLTFVTAFTPRLEIYTVYTRLYVGVLGAQFWSIHSLLL
jgi:hypothetical protein